MYGVAERRARGGKYLSVPSVHAPAEWWRRTTIRGRPPRELAAYDSAAIAKAKFKPAGGSFGKAGRSRGRPDRNHPMATAANTQKARDRSPLWRKKARPAPVRKLDIASRGSRYTTTHCCCWQGMRCVVLIDRPKPTQPEAKANRTLRLTPSSCIVIAHKKPST